MTLTADEVADMATTCAEALPTTGVIQRNTPADDGQGGETESWATLSSPSARLRPVNSSATSERVVADRLQVTEPFVLTLAAGTNITEADRWVSGGATFQVFAVLAPESWELERRVLVGKVA